MPSEKGLYTCLYNNCANAQVVYAENGKGKCNYCMRNMEALITIKKSEYVNFLPESGVAWAQDSLGMIKPEIYELWPGPVAVEYRRLVVHISERNIEAACWKLMNLCDIILDYLRAALYEVGKVQIKPGEENPWQSILLPAINYAKDKNVPNFPVLIEAIKCTFDWRNSIGIGHGTLTENKLTLINDVTKYIRALNMQLTHFRQYLELLFEPGASLYLGNQELTGSSYYEKITEHNQSEPVHIRKESSNNEAIKVLQYQFEGPDLYFLDFFNSRRSNYKYRNFTNNRVKYLVNTKEDAIAWYEDIKQVAWLNCEERKNWLEYCTQRRNLGEFIKLLIGAAEGF